MLKKVRPGIVIDVRVSQFFMLGDTKVTLLKKDAQLCQFQIQPEESGKVSSYVQDADLGETVSVGKACVHIEKKHGQVARLRVVAEKGIVIRRQNVCLTAAL